MAKNWLSALRLDPLPALNAWPDLALAYFVHRDLLEELVGPVDALWKLPQAIRLLDKQQPDGSWRYPGKPDHPAPGANYHLLETYRSLRLLVEIYGFQRHQPAITKATEYVFTCQTDEGDLRGILGNQYMPYYHAVIMELLIKTGYAKDKRVEKGLRWLLSMRQTDGGWIIPAQHMPASGKTDQFWLDQPLLPDRFRPHSHLATGMVLRAFAAHPDYRQHPKIIVAGQRLKERFFQPDKYNDRKAAAYWLKFQFPFWWPNLLTALDALSRLDFGRKDADIARGLDWFLSNQSADGLWEIGYGSGQNIQSMRRWVGLAVCRVLKRFFDQEASL
jgi:hypothetical protein